jgi:Tfp pilus assembly protein PilF
MQDPIGTTPPPGHLGEQDSAGPAPGFPLSPDAPLPVAGGRYRLLDEIARGGMGVVFRALDTTLGREVAVKVLHDRFEPTSVTARRFADEAWVTGQLQHPAIPAVHDLGALPDGRPFLAMKLVKGRTLALLLKERPDSAHDRGRFLAIFEQVCQAVGFAHAHKVIHRDLKPLNVMVGGFGEVQVMDWGLAKVLTASGRALPEPSDPEATAGTEIHPARQPDCSFTQAGSVLGTPAFMPPEQAGGEIGKIDERADVFGLGAILAVVLTGEPPYVGRDSNAVRLMAVRGQLDDCLARLDRSQAEPELVALCRRCLALDPADRPCHAEAVAKEVGDLRAAAEERARQAELERVRAEGDRARAEAETREQRKRRRVQAALGLTFTALVALGGAFAWWEDRRAARLRREREVATARARQGAEAAEVLAARLRDQFRFAEAIQAIDQAAEQVPADAPDDIWEDLDRARADLVLVRDLDEVRFSRIRSDVRAGSRALPQAYRAAFQARGMDPSGQDPAVAEAILASPIRLYLVAALDDWAHNESSRVVRDRLLTITRCADPGEWGDRLRNPANWRGAPALRRDVEQARVADLPPHLLVLLLQTLQTAWTGSRAALAQATARHAGDFWLQFEVGYYYAHKDRDPARAVASLRAALAIRPDCRYAMLLLADACHQMGDLDGAIVQYREAIRLAPNRSLAHQDLAALLQKQRKLPEAEKVYRQVIERNPTEADACYNLGMLLQGQGKLPEAEKLFRQAVAHTPNSVWAHIQLGWTIQLQDRLVEGEKALRRAVDLDPSNAHAHNALGWVLLRRGKLAEAEKVLRRAFTLDPGHQVASGNLARVLEQQGKWSAVVDVHRQVLARSPATAWARTALPRAERLAALVEKLPAFVKGELHPRDSQERLELAKLCTDSQLYRAAVTFYANALADEHLVGGEKEPHRYVAACAAALAGTGYGKDVAGAGSTELAQLRYAALAWLQADLGTHAEHLAGPPGAAVEQSRWWLLYWQQDAAFTGVRADALRRLPEAEQVAWRNLWAQVAALLARSSAPTR